MISKTYSEKKDKGKKTDIKQKKKPINDFPNERKTRLELATLTLARLCSTN